MATDYPDGTQIILGIDPGSRRTGYGVIAVRRGREELVAQGILDVRRAESHVLRLKQIYEGLAEIVAEHPPDLCAVEMPIYGKNPQSMLKLGRAQAAAMMVALLREVPVTEYTPAEVKKSVTGNGQASKNQVGYMVRSMLDIDREAPLAHDAADALAVALCHAHRSAGGAAGGKKSYSGWAAFVSDNPDRVR